MVGLYVSDFEGHDWWATGLFIPAMTTDWFDGWVARSRGRSSPLGSLLDYARVAPGLLRGRAVAP